MRVTLRLPWLQKRHIRRLLRERVPEGKHFSREAKVETLLPEAIAIRAQGYDFEIAYEEEQGHFEKAEDKIVGRESSVDGGQYMGYGKAFTTIKFESGETFSWHSDDEWSEGFELPEPGFYEKWIIDKPESVTLVKGRKL